jgi:hypothetical protein
MGSGSRSRPQSDYASDEATRVHSADSQLSLRALDGPLEGRVFGTVGHPITLGRSELCAVVLPIAESSRMHARIEYRRGQFWVADLDTLNGIRLNGDLVDQPTALREGDVLAIGGLRFMVSLRALPGREIVHDHFDGPPPPRGDTRPISVGPPPLPRAPQSLPPAPSRKRSRRPQWIVLAAMGAVTVLAVSVRFTLLRSQIGAPALRVPPVSAAPPRVVSPAPEVAPPRVVSPAPEVAPPQAAEPVQAMLVARDPISVHADSAGHVRRAVEKGAWVETNSVLVEYRPSSPDADAKLSKLHQLQARYGDSPEHEDFIAKARADYEEANRARSIASVRAPASGIVVSASVTHGHFEAGVELMKIARLIITADPRDVEGAGEGCTAALLDHGQAVIEARRDRAAAGAVTLIVSRLPEGLAPGPLGRVRIRCDAR